MVLFRVDRGHRRRVGVKRDAYRLLIRVAFAAKRQNRFFGTLQRKLMGMQPFEPVSVVGEQTKGLDVGVAPLGIDPLYRQLLIKHTVDVESDRGSRVSASECKTDLVRGTSY